MTRTVLPKLLLAAGSTVLCLALLEGAARIARRFEGGGKEQRNRLQYVEHDPLLGWRKRPGSRTVFDRRDYRVEVVINSQGLRDRERTYERPGGALRVLALGDSFLEGYSVPFEHSVTQVLERRLQTRTCPVEVINGGTAGYSTDQEYLFYRSEGTRYGAQLVLLFFYFNDVLYNTSSESSHVPKPRLSFRGEVPTVANYPVPMAPPEPARDPAAGPEPIDGSAALDWVRGRLQRSAPRAYNAISTIGIWPPIRPIPINPELRVYMRRPPVDVRHAWNATAAILRALALEAGLDGGRLLVVYIPSRMEIRAEDWQLTSLRYGVSDRDWEREAVVRGLTRVAEEARIPVLDLTPALQRADVPFRRTYYEHDNHWNARGHSVAAEAIEGFLRSQGLVGCTSSP